MQRTCAVVRAALNDGAGSVCTYVPSVRYPDLRVFQRTWDPPSNAPRAGLLIAHGGMWHSGWFGEVAQALAASTSMPCRVVATDYLSHGMSDDIDGIRGYFTDTADIVDDLHAALDRLESSLPEGAPLFLLGESVGGVMALLLAMRPGITERLTGMILCGAAVRVNPDVLPPAPVLSGVKVLGPYFPKVPLPLNRFAGKTFDAAFGDRSAAQLAKDDPLVLFDEAPRLGAVVAMLGAWSRLAENMGKVHVRNLLVLHNKNDCRTEYSSAEELVSRVQCQGTLEFVNPGGMGHQLLQDVPEIKSIVINRIEAFMSRVGNAAVGGRKTVEVEDDDG